MPTRLDIPPAIASGLSGFAIGGGLTAIFNAIGRDRRQREMLAAIRAEEENDDEALVLHVPRKTAGVIDGLVDSLTKRGPEAYTGSTWPWHVAALAGSGYLGSRAVTKMMDDRVVKDLEKQEDEAQQAFLEAVSQKTAQLWRDDIGYNRANKLTGSALLTILLGTGLVGYGTKKYLDKEETEADAEIDASVPKIERVVVKQAAADMIEDIVRVHMALQDPLGTVRADEKLARDLAAEGGDWSMLAKLASEQSISGIRAFLQNAPTFRRQLQMRAIDQKGGIFSGLKKFAIGLPGFKQLADNATYRKAESSPFATLFGGAMGGLKPMGGFKSGSVESGAKAAASIPLAVLASFAGSTLADEGPTALELEAANKPQYARKIRVSAEDGVDPAHVARLNKVLQQLAAEGEI